MIPEDVASFMGYFDMKVRFEKCGLHPPVYPLLITLTPMKHRHHLTQRVIRCQAKRLLQGLVMTMVLAAMLSRWKPQRDADEWILGTVTKPKARVIENPAQ